MFHFKTLVESSFYFLQISKWRNYDVFACASTMPMDWSWGSLVGTSVFSQVVAKCLYTCACTSHVDTPTSIQGMCYTRQPAQGSTGAKWLRVRRTKPIKIYLRAAVVARNSRRIPRSLRSSTMFMPVESGDFCSREQAVLAYFRSVAKIGSENLSLERSIVSFRHNEAAPAFIVLTHDSFKLAQTSAVWLDF